MEDKLGPSPYAFVECFYCFEDLLLSSKWYMIDAWLQARKLVNDVDYEEWLDKNPIPEYAKNNMESTGVLQEDGSYVCSRGHKWRING